MEVVFEMSSLLVLPFWLLIIVLPSWRVTRRLMQSPWVPSLAAALYAALVLPRLAQILPAVLHPTLSGIAALLGSSAGATIAWAHFLCFDLFVGRWAYLDSRERGLSALLMAPVLFLILMLGPLGFLLYLSLRALDARKILLTTRSRQALALNLPLAVTVAVHLGLLAAALVGLAVDHRSITGVPVWLKPAKFAFSISLYCATLLWLLSHLQGRRRLVGAVSWVTAGAFVAESVILFLQAGRGTTSHFNISTPLNAVLWGAMGFAILCLWAVTLIAVVLLIRQRLPDPAFAWSLRFGLLLTLVGMALALPMVAGPTVQQQAVMRAGGRLAAMGGHAVGVPEDAHGLPGVDWKTGGGDLRVPHFVGLHALQVFPLLGWLLTRRRARRLGDGTRTALVKIAGVAYLGVMLLLEWQALRGQSVVHPDGATLQAFAALGGVTALSTVVVLFRRPRRRATPPTAATISRAPAVS